HYYSVVISKYYYWKHRTHDDRSRTFVALHHKQPTLVYPLEPFRRNRKPGGRLRHLAISKHQQTVRTTPAITHHTALSPTRIANTHGIKTHTTKLRPTNNTEYVITHMTPNHDQTPQSETETTRHPSRKQDHQ